MNSLSIELISKNSKSTVLFTFYKPLDGCKLDGDFQAFNAFLKDVYSLSLKFNKLFYATGNFNLNVLEYNKNEKVMKFLNLTFEYGLVPVNNKPTRDTKNTDTAIDHVIVNWLLHKTINTGIIKLDISNHFPIFLIAETENWMNQKEKYKLRNV